MMSVTNHQYWWMTTAIFFSLSNIHLHLLPWRVNFMEKNMFLSSSYPVLLNQLSLFLHTHRNLAVLLFISKWYYSSYLLLWLEYKEDVSRFFFPFSFLLCSLLVVIFVQLFIYLIPLRRFFFVLWCRAKKFSTLEEKKRKRKRKRLDSK